MVSTWPTPIRAEQGEELTGVDRKGQTIDRRECAEAASKTFDVQHDFTHKKTQEAGDQAN
jgi:hypothetical protein